MLGVALGFEQEACILRILADRVRLYREPATAVRLAFRPTEITIADAAAELLRESRDAPWDVERPHVWTLDRWMEIYDQHAPWTATWRLAGCDPYFLDRADDLQVQEFLESLASRFVEDGAPEIHPEI